MNRITALIISAAVIVAVFIAPLVFTAITGDFTALIRTITGLEEDSAVMDIVFTAHENFFL